MYNMKAKSELPEMALTIRKAFKRSGWTRAKLARESGVAYSAVHRFLGAERDISLWTVQRLCDTLSLELRPKR